MINGNHEHFPATWLRTIAISALLVTLVLSGWIVLGWKPPIVKHFNTVISITFILVAYLILQTILIHSYSVITAPHTTLSGVTLRPREPGSEHGAKGYARLGPWSEAAMSTLNITLYTLTVLAGIALIIYGTGSVPFLGSKLPFIRENAIAYGTATTIFGLMFLTYSSIQSWRVRNRIP